MNTLDKLAESARVNSKPVTVNVGLLKVALSEIKMQQMLNGGTWLTNAAISSLEDVLKRAGVQ